MRRLPLALLAAALIWLALRQAWDPALGWVTQGLSRLFEAPWATQIVVDQDHAIIGRRDMRADSGRLSQSLTQIEFNLVPFLALVLAIKGWWRQDGLQRLGGALLLFFMSHVLSLLWHVKYFFATSLGPWSQAGYSDAARQVYGALRYFFDIPVTFTLPLLLWVGFFSTKVFALLEIEEAIPPGGTRRGKAR